MNFTTIFRVLGLFLMIFSSSMLPPLFISLIFKDTEVFSFLIAFLLTLITGFICWIPFRKIKKELKIREGFLIVVLFWVVLSLFAAIPFIISKHPDLSFTDAIFESVSGLTTTGASVILNIDHMPHSLLYYRQQLQFLGGMGIVVLAVAILPMLNIGGLQLYRAEMPGPTKDNKLTPKIAETAKALWYIYVGLTVLCALAYWASGMHWFHAIGESFATVSTGGFGMHDNSFEYYDNALTYWVGIVFMILGGTNFSLHFFALQRKNVNYYWQDPEFRVFISILFLSSLITSLMLIIYQVYNQPMIALSKATFNAVSLATTTGYMAAPFQNWPTFIPFLLLITALIGGSAGSTAGGIKVMRVMLLYHQGLREVKRLIHPQGVFPIKLGKHILAESKIQSIWGFIAIFFVLFLFLMLLLMATGEDFVTSFGAIVATLAHAGVGIGDVSETFATLNSPAKWILTFSMLAGRLEIFTLLVLFSPYFWRK